MDKKAVRSWAMYDWANSAFATIIIAAVMPIFYSKVAANTLAPATATAYWGYTQSISLILVVILSPLLGAIADASNSKKKFLRFFVIMGVLATTLMFTIGEGDWLWASLLLIVGTLGFSGANVFYDAFLSDVAPEKDRDMVSAKGFSYGYVGGGSILALSLALITFHDKVGISSLSATQISFFATGIWWLLFSIPIFRNVHEKKIIQGVKQPPMATALSGFRSVWQTIRAIKQYPELLKFLIAFWFFSDGINTIVKMSVIFGAEIGIGQQDLITALLITQFVGFPCTLFFGKIASKFGSKLTLVITLCVYLFITILGYRMENALDFYILATLVGTVQGGSQALARSIFTRIVPAHRNAEFFGFYGLSGKFAAIFGPAAVAIIGQLTGSNRTGIASVAFFFIVGIIMLFFVNLDKGKEEAEAAVARELNQ
ncbi:MFS transporter [Hazenella sp. IB182353]|uniref:MFS transporter n=1 Tax=Polycladospora coralii TaxID=2771432 RepID=UPI00174657E9|nr:MFS transporter [Polycladospora coralii]MBS7531400.1 MFS transporter [Polycladospora coralii]